MPTTPETMTIVTRPCMLCMKASHVEVTPIEYLGYMVHGMLIQDAMPTRSVDFRELIITGTHPQCWTDMFGDGDDDLDYCGDCGHSPCLDAQQSTDD